MRTYLVNADIFERDGRVYVTTRSGGLPSNPQSATNEFTALDGETLKQTFDRAVAEYTDENGE